MSSKEYHKAYRARTKEARAEYQREYFKKYPNRFIFWQIRTRARTNGIPFDLEEEDIVIPDVCPILGIPLFRNAGGNRPTGNSPSVDRKDPAKGYTKDNIWIISQRANVMKNDATTDELRKFANWVNNSLL